MLSANIEVYQTQNRTFSMAEYLSFVNNIDDEVQVFKKRQAQGVASEDARSVPDHNLIDELALSRSDRLTGRERILFAEWDAQRRAAQEERARAISASQSNINRKPLSPSRSEDVFLPNHEQQHWTNAKDHASLRRSRGMCGR